MAGMVNMVIMFFMAFVFARVLVLRVLAVFWLFGRLVPGVVVMGLMSSMLIVSLMLAVLLRTLTVIVILVFVFHSFLSLSLFFCSPGD